MCDCPVDWVACFKVNCNRSKSLNDAVRAHQEKATKLLGDQSKGIQLEHSAVTSG